MARTHSPEPNRHGFGTLKQGGMEGKKEERKGRVVSFEEDQSYKCVNGEDTVWGKYENGDDYDKDPIRSKAKIENFLEFPRYGAKVGDGFLSSKSEKIKERLQQSIRDEVKEKIANILHEVEQLSDVEKLLLYLQLPTGIPVDDVLKQKSHNNPLGKKADIEVFQTCTWIQTHLMEDPNVSLPKQEVYEEYKSFCSSNNLEPLCAADFGKVMKQVFPSVKPRRLGTRGNSRYCYSGLTKNLTVKLPGLPNISCKKEASNVESKDSSDDDMHNAACQLVLEWAEKLLEEKFTALTDLAWYLVESLCVDSRSVAAFTLLFLSNVDEPRKGNQAANFLKQVCGNRKRETQIHLQRKLHEKELIKEQKKKVQEQRQIAKSILNKTSATRKCQRTLSKKASVTSQSLAAEKIISSTKELCVSPMLEDKNSQCKSNDNDETIDEGGKLLHSLQTSEKLITQQVEISNSIEQGCDESEVKQKIEKVPIPRKSTRTSAVCISPGMSGIIAVSPVQITLLGPQASPKSNKFEKKYKRIQPKSNASKITNKSSTVLPIHHRKSNKKQSNETNVQKGRKPSNLWNHTEEMSNERSSEESNGTKVAPPVVNNCTLPVASEKSSFEVDSIEAAYPVICSNNGNATLNLGSNLNFDNSGELDVTNEMKNVDKEISNTDFSLDREELYNNFISSDASNVEDVIPTTVKRHCEDPNPDATASKKPLLENIFKSAVSCLPSWEIKENAAKLEPTDKLLAETLIHVVNAADKQTVSNCEQEEVSIYKLETDALIEYFQDLSADSNPVLHEKLDEHLCDKNVQQQAGHHISNQKQQPTNTAAQLSQLRMLLERNLPKPTNKNAAIRNLKNQSSRLETQDLPTISSVMALHNDCFHSKDQQETESKLSELSEIVLRETSNIVSKVSASNYDEKLTDVCWSESGEESIALQKNGVLEETHLVENMSDDQVISHIQNSILSGENSDDTDIRNGIPQQPITIASSNNLSNLSSFSDSNVHNLHNLNETKCISTYTQIPSVPPSPNARRRAFNFLPISPRQTPILESAPSGNTVIASPIPSQYTATSSVHNNTISVAVGSSRPTSAASSPFVSPRSTPVPLSRSRHNSGQSLYSASRQTPLQNFDSGVSSISTSPFISPQPTPLPVSRLRHNSNHSQNRTVTFNATSSPHAMYSQSIFTGSRSRHNSGPGIPHQLGQTMSPRSAPLSPMVSECHTQSHFSFPCVGDTPTLRSRHNSASSAAPLSPVSEQIYPPSNNSEVQINNDQLVSCDTALTSQYSLNLNKNQELESSTGTFESNSGDTQYQQLKSLLNSKILLPHSPSSKHQQPAKLATVQSELKQQWLNNRQRHASGPLLFQRSNQVADQSSQEIQLLLRNASYSDPYTSSNRSQSVPPYQMLQNLISQCNPLVHEDSIVSKSHPTTPVISNSFTFSPSKVTSSSSTVMETATFISPPLASDAMFSAHITDPDELLVNGSQSQAWDSLNREINGVPISARRNITDILGQPREDLEVTLDDLRDFDTDFSKLAQELEDMNRNDESDLS